MLIFPDPFVNGTLVSDASFEMFGSPVPNSLFFALLGVSGVLALVAILLLVHLCLFHSYINC